MRPGFDVIVVGAGSAGCVVAARLAEDPSRRVLLLEAGPDPSGSPGAALWNGWALARGPDWPYDWGYTAEPEASGDALPVRRGRVVGGTSWLTRFAVRGAPGDFDGWAARGLEGWALDQIASGASV
jgi:choline dehydrogenase